MLSFSITQGQPPRNSVFWDLLGGNVQELEGGEEGLAIVQNSG